MSKLVYYSQEDPRWRNIMYSSHGDATQTIGKSACGPTCVAMAISTLTGQDVLPTTTAAYAVKHGYRTDNSGTAWDFYADIAKQYGLSCTQTGSLGEAKEALRAGKLVVASMGRGHFTSGGHYILLVGIPKEGWIEVYDPNQDNHKYGVDGLINEGISDDGKVTAKDSVFAREAKQYWIIYKESVDEVTREEYEALNKKIDGVVSRVKELEEVVNVSGNQEPPAWAHDAIAAAKAAGAIKTSNDKGRAELVNIQMLYNMGLFEKGDR